MAQQEMKGVEMSLRFCEWQVPLFAAAAPKREAENDGEVKQSSDQKKVHSSGCL